MTVSKINIGKSSIHLRMAAQIDNIKTFDPATSNELAAREVIGNVYERPFQFDGSNGFTSAILSNWCFLSKNVLELTVKDGIVFSSGESLTATDIAFSVERALDMGAEASIAATANLKEVIRIHVADSSRVLVELASDISPNLLFNFLSADFSSIFNHRLSTSNTISDKSLSNLLKCRSWGTGPFELEAWSADEFIELRRNPKTCAATNVQVITCENVPEPEDQMERLLCGQVDIARSLTASEIGVLRTNERFRIEYGPHTGIMYLGLNTLHPALAQMEVIKVIKRSINLDRIVGDILEPGFSSHSGVIPSELSSFPSRERRMSSGEAISILKQLGFHRGFSLRLLVPQMWPVWDVAKYLREDLDKIGIAIELQPISYRELLKRYRERTHDAVLLMWATDFHDPHSNAQSFFFNPNNSPDSNTKTIAWRNGWYDDRANALVAEAMRSDNDVARKDIYHRLQSNFLPSAPFIAIGQKRQVVAMSNNISGFRLLSTGNRYDNLIV